MLRHCTRHGAVSMPHGMTGTRLYRVRQGAKTVELFSSYRESFRTTTVHVICVTTDATNGLSQAAAVHIVRGAWLVGRAFETQGGDSGIWRLGGSCVRRWGYGGDNMNE